MGELRQQVVLHYRTFACCECGVEVALPDNFEEHRRRDHRRWYCPNGHPQHFRGESDVERLMKQVEAETKKRQWAEQAQKRAEEAEAAALRKATAAKKKLKAQTKRVANGVCPCCQRSFTNLRRHMATKHPERAA